MSGVDMRCIQAVQVEKRVKKGERVSGGVLEE